MCALYPPIVLCICATTLCVCLTSPMEGCVFWQFASMRCSCYRLCVLCGTTVPVGQCPFLCVCTLSSNLVVDICFPWCVGLRVLTSPMEGCRSTFRAPIYVGCVRLFRVRCTMCPYRVLCSVLGPDYNQLDHVYHVNGNYPPDYLSRCGTQ